MLTLGIESSCDETSAAVVKDGVDVLSNIIASQHDIHSKYGGVVPELACRRHIENIAPIVSEALSEASVEIKDIDLIAVTSGPGLVVALLVGLSYAKGLAYASMKPLVEVNHLEGHILSILLEKNDIRFPYISMLVSGGHTEIYRVEGIGDYKILGKTRDDAAGEALDKGAKLLGFNYPGGPEIEKQSLKGNPESIKFPRSYMGKDSLEFSFSGVKTFLRNYLQSKNKNGKVIKSIPDIAASYQAAIIDVLSDKAVNAARKEKVDTIVVVGGVACNRVFRKTVSYKSQKEGISVYYPSPTLCTDNAAMIACAGYNKYIKSPKKYNDFLDLDANPSLKLEDAPKERIS